MRRAASLLCLIAVACARPTRGECEQVIDRYVDMKVGDDVEVTHAPESARPEVRDIQKAKKRLEPVYAFRVEQCMREVDSSQLACGRAAPNPNEWEACFH